ncbi:hypothetical protein IP91_00779 [Pseudoduganella lurida]|uniref:Uncharacterized protein n=1 Tax=Pseudoduganella lurida TaxID=1036180 RepID=A0A562RMN4_9BURK|nr:hypothetical protein [Pseudoduganella lurida]TWI69706.1 hypothetical protein IP91_00779 [Pseudoduganella lurida]
MLDKLYFGKDDAETDIGMGGLLSAGFLETTAYRTALAGKKWLFLGRKGAGKSAICLKLQNEFEASGRSSLVTPDEISADEIKRFEMGGIAPYQAKELLWRYILCVQLAKLMLRHIRDHPGKEREAIAARLRQFLVDNGEVDDLTTFERFWRIVERLKTSLTISAFNAVEASITIEPSSGARLSDQVEVVERKIQEYARQLKLFKVRNAFYILIDQIEKVWSNDPGSDTLVIGLLRAGKHAQSVYPFLNCSVFLRIDIYEKLDFKERDKLRSDEWHIRWDSEALINLIQTRAAASTGIRKAAAVLWEHGFPRHVGETDTRKYIVTRTLNRPRDIIQLCNACRDVGHMRGGTTIVERDVFAAAKQYSRWKLVDIQNEWSVNYPFLSDILLLLASGSYLFRREHFARKYAIMQPDLSSRHPALRHQLSADYPLSVLFSISVIGAVRDGEPAYFCNAEFDDTLTLQDESFAIHPCFREALQCQSAIELPQFEDGGARIEAVRERIRRGTSVSGFEDSDVPVEYLTKELHAGLVLLRRQIVALDIAADVREELRMNIAAVDREVTRIGAQFDEVDARDAGERLSAFFKAMSKGLVKAGIMQERSDLYYLLNQLIEYCQEFAFGSRSRRYRLG